MKCINKNTPQVLLRRSITDKQDANRLINNNTPEGSKREHGGQGRNGGRSGGHNFNSNLEENQHKSIAGETSNGTQFATRDSKYTDGARLQNSVARFRRSYLMSSSVTMKDLQSGWEVLSQIAGFFSAAVDD